MKISLYINPEQEVKRIINFLKSVQKKTGIDKVVIGLSGGIDSTTVYYLLQKAYKPENIIGVSLPYLTIEPIASQLLSLGEKILPPRLFSEKVRLGNIMTRVRMIILFDLAKKHNALVCGTENKSERLLGYFTRFGDAASDIEPISHLYKTQVYKIAKYLKVPQKIIDAKPTAGLWPGQSDEGEFGFTYKEADQVLYLYYDKKLPLDKILFNNVGKIIKRVKDNQFKQEVPYKI
ncbi:MAG: NH(3)-dependent NAD(+) synthetase [Candidatus Roizmanbacteria bacterium GW2011_GWC2_37_13]|uniref:NH(3)-dependent NAD(+) synthetase n=1 Tax=Candidatus Roizmanbacteria bacterium GW2011_GWC2_37_13 TaxID=1618486 RepID=A0A0G0ILQ6_9BACT|nr:MAG: NH(3)-dependent NAD(+) synthetase [Candidatus Roizmanbacteria bacterium GW2011_GWC1_37_12]KKQ25134.1 MAG: NH(3)-dependent NAD(+) synthetase [Candidatus Roizmanbacteria bacterium GW2011_GWC2_37_13]